MEKTVEIRNLSIGYKTKSDFKPLIENFSADLFGGQLTCILGANGVGKSTLLRTLSGFMPKLSGEIVILGKEIGDYSDIELARTIGVVLTERPNVGDLTVMELISLGRSPYTGFFGRLNSIDETVAKNVISLIKIEELANRQVLTLSDGEWQKAMIAKTLAQETPLIYLDEPTAFLDFPSKVEIMRLLLNLTRKVGKTIFLSTHDLELALQIADTLWLMDKKNGMIIGTPDELRSNGSIENFFKCDGVVFDRETGFFRIQPPPAPLQRRGINVPPPLEGGRGRLHYFNPGHETAVLNASKHYNQPAQIAKMQIDMAFLPAWYASTGDYVFVETTLPDDYILSCEILQLPVKPVTTADFSENPELFQKLPVDLWGISPQSVHFFEKLNEQWDLSLSIPQWKEEFRFLGSRFASQRVLESLMENIPEIEKGILPQFFSNIESIEEQINKSSDKFIIKSPYSSSGRGLVWLLNGKIEQSERQILNGMLKKQTQVSIEKALDKCLDFSMQFKISRNRETQFMGYSIFQTNSKGAYEKTLLDRQERMEEQITNLIETDLLMKTKIALTNLLQEMYAPYYTGIIGIDMLIYKSDEKYCLHPCVEINMRNNMGYLSICLAEKYLRPDSHGEFSIEYNSDPQNTLQKHKLLQNQYRLIIEDGQIKSGYLNLCPVTNDTSYHVFVVVED